MQNLSAAKKFWTSLLITATFMAGCKKNPETGEVYRPSGYNINGVGLTGQGNVNQSLKAVEVLCSNNNTIRLYYANDSIVKYDPGFFRTDLKVVSSAKAGRLKANECYLEVVTSATDTWLSTGTDSAYVHVSTENGSYVTGTGQKTLYLFDIPPTKVQHFTSMPLTDMGTVKGLLIIKAVD